jgi:hypothetical protein
LHPDLALSGMKPRGDGTVLSRRSPSTATRWQPSNPQTTFSPVRISTLSPLTFFTPAARVVPAGYRSRSCACTNSLILCNFDVWVVAADLSVDDVVLVIQRVLVLVIHHNRTQRASLKARRAFEMFMAGHLLVCSKMGSSRTRSCLQHHNFEETFFMCKYQL